MTHNADDPGWNSNEANQQPQMCNNNQIILDPQSPLQSLSAATPLLLNSPLLPPQPNMIQPQLSQYYNNLIPFYIQPHFYQQQQAISHQMNDPYSRHSLVMPFPISNYAHFQAPVASSSQVNMTLETPSNILPVDDGERSASPRPRTPVDAIGACERCKKKGGGSIGIENRSTNTLQKLCVKCARGVAAEKSSSNGTRYKCYGCGSSFDSFDGARKKNRHQNCSLQQKRNDRPEGRAKAPRRSSTGETSPPSKKQKVTLLDFLLARQEFEIEETEIPFNSKTRSADIAFQKTISVHLTPASKDPPYSVLLQQFYPTVELKRLPAANTSFKPWDDRLIMNIHLPPWPKPEEDDVAKVNIHVQVANSHHIICSVNGKSVRSIRESPSDITFKQGEAVAKPEVSSSIATPSTTDEHTPHQDSSFQQSSNQHPPSRNNPHSNDTGNHSLDGRAVDQLIVSSIDPRGFTHIEFNTANFDFDALERALKSDAFDLNARDNLGYTKEFWCYYFQNMKALEMIQEAKIQKLNFSRLCDEDSVVLNILAFIDCGFTLNLALHSERIYSYLTQRDKIVSLREKEVSNPYRALFGRLQSGMIHMLYSQPIICRSTFVNDIQLVAIEKIHEFIDFSFKHWVIHPVCSAASSKIISMLKEDAITEGMLSEMKVIGCEYGAEHCKSHTYFSQSIKCNFNHHPTLKLNVLGNSVHTLQLVASNDSCVKCFEGTASNTLTHVSLGPQFHIDDSTDVERFITGCGNLRHLELNDVTYRDEEAIDGFWEVVGQYATKLTKISLLFTSQNEYTHTDQIESILWNCTLVDFIRIETREGTLVVNELVKQYDYARMLKTIDLKYESCDEEVLNKFMVLYGNVCDIFINKVHLSLDSETRKSPKTTEQFMNDQVVIKNEVFSKLIDLKGNDDIKNLSNAEQESHKYSSGQDYCDQEVVRGLPSKFSAPSKDIIDLSSAEEPLYVLLLKKGETSTMRDLLSIADKELLLEINDHLYKKSYSGKDKRTEALGDVLERACRLIISLKKRKIYYVPYGIIAWLACQGSDTIPGCELQYLLTSDDELRNKIGGIPIPPTQPLLREDHITRCFNELGDLSERSNDNEKKPTKSSSISSRRQYEQQDADLTTKKRLAMMTNNKKTYRHP